MYRVFESVSDVYDRITKALEGNETSTIVGFNILINKIGENEFSTNRNKKKLAESVLNPFKRHIGGHYVVVVSEVLSYVQN